MLERGLVESGKRRIGAEQEMFLVDRDLRPAPLSLEILQHANDERLTTEIARFNLEANLTPLLISGACFSDMQAELKALITKTRQSARSLDADVLLAGILPTLKQADLTRDNLTPVSRYHELDRGVIRLRGGPLDIHIKGLDELQITHDNIMMESCNTSFKSTFKLIPTSLLPATTWPRRSLLRSWQLLLIPRFCSVIAFGRKPALHCFSIQQTRVLVRNSRAVIRRESALATIGLEHSVVALFHDQISRFRPIMITQPDEDPFQVLARGEIPQLSALRMHNSTVWRWNRACYGVANGVAHLRIENRALPSGPTVVDEIANAAFFAGLMLALPEEYGDISKRMSFDEAKSNFFRAARHGLDAQFTWIDGQDVSAPSLVIEQLLPLAQRGLESAEVEAADINKYLGIIEDRVSGRQTGARWILKSLAAMPQTGSKKFVSDN